MRNAGAANVGNYARMFSLFSGAYSCIRCWIIAHVDCAVSATQNPAGKLILHLPALPDALPSLIMHKRLEEISTTLESSGEAVLKKYHAAHSSILKNDETVHESVCSACIQHIAPPYYSCSRSSCDFLLHKYCTDLPLVVADIFGGEGDLVYLRRNELFFSLFFCELCLRLGNGFGYYGFRNILHLECALAPGVIKHDSHKQHPLILVILRGDHPLENMMSCCGKTNPFYFDSYSCIQCRFRIHVRCALLPKIVTHKFDKHPLTLITDSSAKLYLGDIDDHFCEFCEEDIDPSHWFYLCIQCGHSFHVDCIPSTGRYSRIKFGGTVVLPRHHDHPLTLVRMLSVGSHTCGFCQEIIEGFKDGMALHCAECDFWIHFRCGSESSGATVSEPYQDLSDLLDRYSRYSIELL